MFGNFNLNAGLSQLQDLGGRFQKIKEDLEQNIESSLRTNIAPAAGSNLEQDTSNITGSADGTAAFGGKFALLCKQVLLLHPLSPSLSVAVGAVLLGSQCQRELHHHNAYLVHVQIRGKAIAWVQLPPRHPAQRYFCHMHAMHQNMLTQVAQSTMCRQYFAEMPYMLSFVASWQP